MLLTVLSGMAQMVEPIHWTCTMHDITPQAEEGEVIDAATIEVVWTVTIDEGWHLYAQELPEDGPQPTLFSYGDVTTDGSTTTDAPVHENYDENFMMTLSYYEGTAVFRQRILTQDPSVIRPQVTYMACNDMMCLPPTTFVAPAMEEGLQPKEGREMRGDGQSHRREATGKAIGEGSLLSIFLLGLLGGLLAIFTPCVWPIIPMTVSFFLKRAEREAKSEKQSHKGVSDALLYGLSIILIYVGLGLAVTLLFGASALNALSTNAIVNLIFFALLVVFALSFFGLFEITLPSSWSTKMDKRSGSTSGFFSILFMAFTLVIVSFSCTGPIIGTLLVEAASGQSVLEPTIGMLGFALALALPFSLFALFPNLMKKMPRSGGWMESFKVVLAFLELALSLKFLSVADMAYGWGILPRWLFVACWAAFFFAMGCYLLWKIHTLPAVRKTIRAILIVLSWGFTAYLVPGIFGAPVKVISAFAPPMPIEGREVFHDYEEGLTYARQEGKPVLLDFTGYGCVNCRKMEAYVLSDDSVKARLKDYVVIELYVDDKRDGIGERNSAIQRDIYHANAQPYFIQLDANGKITSAPYAFSTSPEAFLEWLNH